MSKIYVGQKIGLETTFTDDDGVVNLTGGTVAYEYYLPGNSTNTEDGTISGSIVDAATGTAEGEIPVATNDTSGQWRVQAVATVAGDTYRAETTCFTVYPKGAGC